MKATLASSSPVNRISSQLDASSYNSQGEQINEIAGDLINAACQAFTGEERSALVNLLTGIKERVSLGEKLPPKPAEIASLMLLAPIFNWSNN